MKKVVMITGSNGGLGRSIAVGLAHKGYVLALCVRKLDSHHSRNLFKSKTYEIDVRDPKVVHRVVSDVLRQNGRIDVLVNCAGMVHQLLPVEGISTESLKDCFETNIFGPFFMVREILPIMKRQGEGIIINVASKAAIVPVPYLAPYSASKAALVALTQAVAKEVDKEGKDILCCSVCPSGMNTKMRAKVYGKSDSEIQQDPRSVARLITEIICMRKAGGASFGNGANILVMKGIAEVHEMLTL
jgi:NAD(P)-dependent dehydrogenase (short-subunit alcohol dehydrogenase family)